MADDTNSGSETEQGAELGLRAEMAVGEFFLRHGAKIAGVVLAVLVGVGVYGQWRSMAYASQQGTTSAIADALAELPGDGNGPSRLLMLAQQRLNPGGDFDAAKVESVATKLVDIAKGASGAAATEAWLKAAELYRMAGKTAERRTALEGALASAEGVLAYAATAALANLDLEEGKADEGLARFQALTQDPDVFLAKQATKDLAAAQVALGRGADAKVTYDGYLTRWPDAADKAEIEIARDAAAKVTAPATLPAAGPVVDTDAPAEPVPVDAPVPADAPAGTPE